MGEEIISVFLVDDHAMFREGVVALLEREPDIRVVGQHAGGPETLDVIGQSNASVVILDISLPGANGLEICRELRHRVKNIATIILTMHEDERFITQALAYGASGYLTKGAEGKCIPEAIRAVARGELYLGPGIPRSAVLSLGQPQEDPYEDLTHRERQVLQSIAEGKTNRQIAESLGLSMKTVVTHRLHLMRKLDIHDQVSLAKYAIRKGIILLDSE